MTPGAWLVLTVVFGALFLLVLSFLIDAAHDRHRARPARIPIPYPGCSSCLAALGQDTGMPAYLAGYALELHQMGEHTGGVRW